MQSVNEKGVNSEEFFLVGNLCKNIDQLAKVSTVN
jgi:hypothetical protein